MGEYQLKLDLNGCVGVQDQNITINHKIQHDLYTALTSYTLNRNKQNLYLTKASKSYHKMQTD